MHVLHLPSMSERAFACSMIAPRTKFTCIAFRSFSLEKELPGPIDVGFDCVALARCPASRVDRLPTWLGTIQAEQIKGANLVLMVKGNSSAPITLKDSELATLQRRAEFFLWGIAIIAGVPDYATAIRFSGENSGPGAGHSRCRRAEEIVGRQRNVGGKSHCLTHCGSVWRGDTTRET